MKIDDRFKCLSAISTPAFSTFVQTWHRQTFPGPENLCQSFTPRLITLIPIRYLKMNLETWSSPFVHLLTYTVCQKRFSGHGPAFGPLAHAASTALVIKVQCDLYTWNTIEQQPDLTLYQIDPAVPLYTISRMTNTKKTVTNVGFSVKWQEREHERKPQRSALG